MKLKPEELAQHGYSLLDILEHTELVPFVRTYIRKRTIFSMIYYCCNIISVALIIFYFISFMELLVLALAKDLVICRMDLPSPFC